MTRRIAVIVAWGLAGLAIAGGLIAGAFALAGEDISRPASPVVPTATPSVERGEDRTASPTPERTSEPGDDHGSGDEPGDDHGGSTRTTEPGDDHGGSSDSGSGSDDSGSSNSGSGSSNSGSGSDDSGSDDHGDD